MTKYIRDYRKIVVFLGDGVTESRASHFVCELISRGRTQKVRGRPCFGRIVVRHENVYECFAAIGKRGEDQFFVNVIEKGEEND